jgi:hypothetical protein
MGSLYYDLVSIIRNAGGQVQENSITNGWQKRARSSGGFSAPPICVFWHHTASQTSVENDLNYMIKTCSDKPVGNLLIDRSGIAWPIAGGASNCAGKGNQMQFSRGVGSANNGNVWGFQIEVANNGVGEAWPQAQIDAFFLISNALNAFVGNQPSDITSHALGKGNGYTDRKIDPARAEAVQGLWVPRSVNSSGTWDLDDMRNECIARASGAGPTPTPPPDPGPTPEPTPPATNWPASLTSSLPSIAKGDSGWMVKRMQHLLAAHGYMNEGNVNNYDGAWGNGTDGAKQRFDADHGLGGGSDTSCGPKSWAALCGDMPNQSVGASGFNVKIMQHLLACCGFMNEANTANYDGAWGSGTDKAKVNFDNAAGLTPSPPTDCGQKSWTALMTS